MSDGGWNLQDDISMDDPDMHALIQEEKVRQRKGLELIASENFTSKSVLQALGSCLSNKYSEGQPGRRYYGGNEVIDKIELLCKKRALEAFCLSPDDWGVNVQCYSGTPANFAVYTALVGPHGRIMGLHLPEGGHLSHGFMTPSKKISASSLFFESFSYKLDPATGTIDYDKLAENAKMFLPKLIIAGISCYSRHLDYKRFREIADETGALLMADMAHVSGLVSAGLSPSPFEYCDIVTSTTQKTLRGPKSGLIFFRRGIRKVNKDGSNEMYDFEKKIDEAVFPGLQGGPHNNQIAAVAVALRQAMTPEFKAYQRQVIANAQVLAREFLAKKYTLISGGTDNHLIWVDLRPMKVDANLTESVLDQVGIAINRNTCPGDKSALRPGGIRVASPALTSRNMKEDGFVQVVSFIDQGVQLTKEIQVTCGPTLKEFKAKLVEDENIKTKISSIKKEVEQFAIRFPLPGFDNW